MSTLTPAELEALRGITQNPEIIKQIEELDKNKAWEARYGQIAADLRPLVERIEQKGFIEVISGGSRTWGTDMRGRSYMVRHVPTKKDGTPDLRMKVRTWPAGQVSVNGIYMTSETWKEVLPELQQALDVVGVLFDDDAGRHGIVCNRGSFAREAVWTASRDFTVTRYAGRVEVVTAGTVFRAFTVHQASSYCDGGHSVGPMDWVSFCFQKRRVGDREKPFLSTDTTPTNLVETWELVRRDDNYKRCACHTVRWGRIDRTRAPEIVHSLEA